MLSLTEVLPGFPLVCHVPFIQTDQLLRPTVSCCQLHTGKLKRWVGGTAKRQCGLIPWKSLQQQRAHTRTCTCTHTHAHTHAHAHSHMHTLFLSAFSLGLYFSEVGNELPLEGANASTPKPLVTGGRAAWREESAPSSQPRFGVRKEFPSRSD